MVRSFLTRLVDSATRVILLAPCLLVCLACATPLPLDNLEKGMTAEAVRAEFGEPESITGPTWHYTDEEQNWVGTGYCTLFAPLCAFMSPISLLDEGRTLFHIFGVDEKPVILDFEDGRLVRWEVIEPVPVVSSGSTSQWQQHQQWDWSKDARHHQKGHKHDHGC